MSCDFVFNPMSSLLLVSLSLFFFFPLEALGEQEMAQKHF